MGNLGWYQVLTTMAKKVGGPKRLIALFIATGAALDRGAVFTKHKIDSVREEKERAVRSGIVYTVMTEARSNEGLLLRAGDKFKVLETDGDVGLIYRLGDDCSPYYVSLKFLSEISDFQIMS